MRVIAAILALFAAGCLTAPVSPIGGIEPPAIQLRLGANEAAGATPLLWNLSLAEGQREHFTVIASLEGTNSVAGALGFAVQWGLYEDRDFDLSVRAPDGTRTDGVEPDAAIGARSLQVLQVPGSAALALFENPVPGEYVVEVFANRSGGSAALVAQWDGPTAQEPTRDLLPNLITLPPRDLGIRDPEGFDDATAPAGVKGCRADEALEMGARRCLRFSNGIANVGEGPLEMRLELEEGATGAGSGPFVQRIERSDGSTWDREAGVAAFHANHGHYHYTSAALFEVYAYDPATGERGERVAESMKTGFCFADLDLAALDLPHTRPPRFDASGCFDPTVHGAWTTGLNPNWYDRYHWTWFEQYVDVQGVPDGVYELVSTANSAGAILETDTTDNEASVIFRLTGDVVELVDH